jgi:hypothetical protein
VKELDQLVKEVVHARRPVPAKAKSASVALDDKSPELAAALLVDYETAKGGVDVVAVGDLLVRVS